MLHLRDAKCTVWFGLGGAVSTFALIAYFYAGDQKSWALQIIALLNPLSRLLPRLTENWRLNTANVRLYDGLVILSGAAEGLFIGATIDILRRLGIGSSIRNK
jgi:hypothetical protein